MDAKGLGLRGTGWVLAGGLAVAALVGAARAAPAPAPPSPQGAGGAPAAAPRQAEPTNVLPRTEDARFRAVRAAREALLARMSPVTDDLLAHAPDGDWLTWRRTWSSTGKSPLKAIDRTNVGKLTGAWSLVLPVSGNEITPLVHDGVMFLESGATVMALDAATGDRLWQYVRELPANLNGGRATIIKNIAIAGDRVFAPTADGHMVALDARTGRLLWDHAVLGETERAARLSLDGGPVVARGKVMMGTSGCNTYAGGCFIFGLDAATGAEAWRFHTIARPGEVGGDTWNGAPVNQRYGGSVWTSGSYDPELNLVFFGIGQTYDTATLLTPQAAPGGNNDALFTDSTVAIDPDTGRLAWHFQHVNRDIWDLDWVFEQALVTLPVNGTPRKLVVTGGKIALFDAVDRANGRFAFARDAGIQTLITAVDPKTGAKTIRPDLKPEPGVTKPLCPHSGGGRNWPATSIDEASGLLYVQLFETCQEFTWKPKSPEETARGGNDMQWVLRPRPDSDGRFGRVQAIDLKTGKTVWMQRRRVAYASSTLVTGGGLLFVGAGDRYFYAYDAAKGTPLWRTRLPARPSATPITYTANGRQYVAIVAGNGGPVAWPSATPEIENPVGGTTLMVFALPEATVPAE